MADEGDVAVEAAAAVPPPEPVKVDYCPVCTMPFEYCEFSPTTRECYEALQKVNPDLLAKLLGDTKLEDVQSEMKAKNVPKAAKPKAESGDNKGPKGIKITLATRRGRKKITTIEGLAAYDKNLKKAAKAFATKFAASSSATGDDEISVQGDITDDIEDFLVDKWPEIKAKDIKIIIKKDKAADAAAAAGDAEDDDGDD